MKETGTTHWLSENTGATNTSGFTTLPGGIINNSKGFGNLYQSGFFWSATQNSSTTARSFKLEYNLATVTISDNYKYGGLSVRCVKD